MSPPSLVKLLLYRKTRKHSGIVGTPMVVRFTGLDWTSCSRTIGTDRQTNILLLLYEIIAELQGHLWQFAVQVWVVQTDIRTFCYFLVGIRKYSGIVGTPMAIRCTGLGWYKQTSDRQTSCYLYLKLQRNCRDTFGSTLYRFRLDILLQNRTIGTDRQT